MDDDRTSPEVAALVPTLQPRDLHGLILTRGLDSAAELIAVASPEQLSRVFDLDLWRAPAPGRDDVFDAHRFGEWLEAFAECTDAVAVEKLSALDVDLLVAGLSRHVRVFDIAAVRPFTTADGDEVVAARIEDFGRAIEIDRYHIVGRHTDAWDAIVALLSLLDADAPERFRDLMVGCRRLSNAGFELDGLDDLPGVDRQLTLTIGQGRDARREEEGFVAAADARAFLEQARRRPVPRRASVDAGARPAGPGAAIAFREGRNGRYPRLDAYMAAASRAGVQASTTCLARLAYLGNVLASGCSLQGRPFTPDEAGEAAMATCNLGLVCLGWDANRQVHPVPDFTSVFEAGWATVYQEVTLHVAAELIAALGRLEVADRQTQAGLTGLRLMLTRAAKRGTPWEVRDDLDVLATLDLPVWTALLGLVSEYPVIPAALPALLRGATTAIDPTAFVLISEREQLRDVTSFMRALPRWWAG